jgi:hypothetical protein
MPTKISNGVARKPPPTPNMPASRPAAPPSANRTKTFIDCSAIGR